MLFFRVALFATIAFLCTTGWWVAIVPAAVWYCFVFDGYELIVLGALADIHFGSLGSVPYLTLLFIIVVVVVGWLKPRLMVYTTKTNV